MTPADLYRTCRVSAYRLETLQHYAVPDDADRQRAFHAGRPLPPPRPSKKDDLRTIRQLTAAGRKVGRVHIIDRPLSDYVRYELAVYRENAASGEDVRIADRSHHPELAAMTQDFAIFDGETDNPAAVLFDYDEAGRLVRHRIVGREAAPAYWAQFQMALRLSVPLDAFMANNA